MLIIIGPFFTVSPWAANTANMAKNQKSISEIGLRHPLLYLLCGCVHIIGVKVDALEIKRQYIYSNQCLDLTNLSRT